MARRTDTNWRDGHLALRAHTWGFHLPAPGLVLPMVEYDRGQPQAVISYMRRGTPLPIGKDIAATYRALGSLYRKTGETLPFFTAQYDPRNWAFRMFGHNDAARNFLDSRDWVEMNEQQFVANLFRLRSRYAVDLAPYGVVHMRDPWIPTEPSPDAYERVAGLRGEPTGPEPFPQADISKRRREYEPVEQVRASWRNPCVDLDQVVVDRDDQLAAVVDYKAPGARINIGSTNLSALSSLYPKSHHYDVMPVPAYVAQYTPHPHMWRIRVHCANLSARLHLSYVLGSMNSNVDTMAETIAGHEWVDLSEAEWKAVLYAAAEL